MLFLCLTKHHTIKKYWGVEVQIHTFLTSALDGGEWPASCPGYFIAGARATQYSLEGRLGEPNAGLDMVAKRNKSHYCPCWEMNPGCPDCSVVSILSYPGLKYRENNNLHPMQCKIFK
jgi:hypothetical protein